MRRPELRELPQDVSALRVDMAHPNRTLIDGCFRERVQVGGEEREFLTYIPKDLEYCQPCLVVAPPSQADPLEYLCDSGLQELAEEKKLFVHLMVCGGKRWDDGGRDAEFMNAVYVAIQSRDYYVTMQDNIYACGMGDGAVIAHQAAQRMASEWSGLFSFGELTACLNPDEPAGAQEREQGNLELKVYAQKAQLPVWIVAEGESEAVRSAIDYWKEQNDVDERPYSGQGADMIFMPKPVKKTSEVNEERISQVRVTLGSDQVSADSLGMVWDYIGLARRHRSYGKKILRYFKDPIACGATLHEMTLQGMNRLWYEYVPAACTPDRKWPLVLCMHGRGGTAETFFDISCMSAVAEERKFIAVFPQASIHQQKPGGLKNVLLWSGSYEGEAFDDVTFLRGVVEDVASRLPVDRGRIYSSGQSSGGIMTDVLCNSAGDLFTACACWSGMYHPKKVRREYARTDAIIPTMFLVGINDRLCTTPEPDSDFPFSLVPELKVDIVEKLERCGLDKADMQTWTQDPITWYCYPDKQGVPMLTMGIVRDMAHANYPEESWISYDQFFCHFSKDEQGRLLYRGKVVQSALRRQAEK